MWALAWTVACTVACTLCCTACSIVCTLGSGAGATLLIPMNSSPNPETGAGEGNIMGFDWIFWVF